MYCEPWETVAPGPQMSPGTLVETRHEEDTGRETLSIQEELAVKAGRT